MSGPLTLMRQSLSNPAWMRAKLAERAMRDPKELENISQLLKYLEYQKSLNPEKAFDIQQATEKGIPTLELLQERLPGFKKGGLARYLNHARNPRTKAC